MIMVFVRFLDTWRTSALRVALSIDFEAGDSICCCSVIRRRVEDCEIEADYTAILNDSQHKSDWHTSTLETLCLGGFVSVRRLEDCKAELSEPLIQSY